MRRYLFFFVSKVFLPLLIGFLFVTSSYGQDVKIRGQVKDAGTDEAIVGANVMIKGSQIGTATELDGGFALDAPQGTTLVISYLGYITQEVKVTDPSRLITVLLQEDSFVLEEVVAIGYAIGSQKTISGAVKKIGQDDMNVGLVNNPLQAIKGKVSGVNITKNGGDPTASANIRIRGTTSLSGGNDPLVVIDGVFGDLSLLNALAPADIESYTILKDASETAQYGSRGASGVIVVTTVKGKAGMKEVSYNGIFGVESVYKNLKMLNADQYRAVAQERGYTGMVDRGYNTNFIEEMERTGFTQNHQFSFGAGTSDLSNYRVSLGIIDQQGIIRNNDMQNFTAKMDVSQMMFDKKLQLDMGMFGSKLDKRYLNDYQKTFYSAASYNPTFPTFPNEDGTYPEDANANEVQNPMGRLQINDRESYANVNTHAKITWMINDDLRFAVFGSYTYGQKENSKYTPTTIKAGATSKGEATKSMGKSESLMGNATLNYKKRTDKHYFDILGLAEVQTYKYTGFNAAARGFDTDYFLYNKLSAGANVKYGDVGSYDNGYSLVSFMGRFNYIYDEKYIATVNVRGDGSSKLGANNKWGFFPSASLAWDIKEEDFMEDYSSISKMKLRAGYGLTGNQDAISAYNSLMLMEPNGTTTVNGTPTVTYGYTRNANPDLRWEVKRMLDVGIDMGFLKDRITATIDYYASKTTDLLYNYDVPVPPFVYPTLLANLGEMQNNGLEVSIGVIPIQTKDMELNITANFAYQTNELLSLSGTYMGQELSAKKYMNLGGMNGAGFIGGYNQIIYQIVGQPLGVFYLPKCNGLIDNGFGDYTYNILDIDGVEGVSLEDGKDRYIAGQAMPKYYLAGNINFRYKQLDFQTQFNGAFGHKIYNGTSLTYMNMNQFPTYNVMDGAPEKNIKDQTVTDYWLEKGDYLQIDYLSLGYTFNTSRYEWLKGVRVSASVNNLYTFTNYSGLSPMINSSVVGGDLGVDDKRFYPLSRSYTLGLSINF